MIQSDRWFGRKFEWKPPVGTFPMIVERLRGTPIRIEDKVRSLSTEALTERIDDTWSIQENAGHLLDLEDLWSGRLDDFLSGAQELRPADVTNRATHEGNHNANKINELTKAFRSRRLEFVGRLDELEEAQAAAEAHHPRLKQPMRLIDLCFFTAEHDDQHLARMTELATILRSR
jgi:uncharacterized damage-inducible protein DinB